MSPDTREVSGAGAALRRRAARRAGLVLGVLALGILGLYASERYMGVVLVKPPAPLQKELSALPLTLSAVTTGDRKIGPYELVESRTLPADQLEELGTQEYLLRDYRDKSRGLDAVGALVSLNLNYYATGSATPHVPDICWAGAGLQCRDKTYFTIKDVKHRDGSVSDVRMHLLSFVPQPRDEGTTALLPEKTKSDGLINVAYTFQVSRGKYVANRDEVAKEFWDPRSKYAYHTKIEITVRKECTAAEAQVAIEDFLRAALPEIEGCLPDAAKLAAEGSEASAGTPAVH